MAEKLWGEDGFVGCVLGAGKAVVGTLVEQFLKNKEK